ncbi:MAG: hypothetical protein AAGA56_16765 [Myxococcota bacterium]
MTYTWGAARPASGADRDPCADRRKRRTGLKLSAEERRFAGPTMGESLNPRPMSDPETETGYPPHRNEYAHALGLVR